MPNWDRSLDLFVNVGTSPEFVLLASRASLQPAERPVLVSGDKHLLRVWFLKPGAAGVAPTILSLDVGEQIVFAGKTTPAAAALIFSATGFIEVNDADGLHYEAELDLTSDALRNAFGDDASLTAFADFEVQNGANTLRRTRQFSVLVRRGCYTNDAVPTPAEPAYPAPGALLTSGPDTANLKRGTKQLAAADYAAVAIAFATEFATPPTLVQAWLLKQAADPGMSVTVNHDSITTAGLTIDLGAEVPAGAALGDYRVGWLAIL